jgi:hypothetical protein
MAKKISKTIVWVIAIIAILAFIGAIYLLIASQSSSGNTIYSFSGNAVSPPSIDESDNTNPVTSCTWGDHRTCSLAYGSECRRRYGAGYDSWCTGRTDSSVTCECLKDVV